MMNDAKERRDAKIVVGGIFLAIAVWAALVTTMVAAVVIVALAVTKWAWTYLLL